MREASVHTELTGGETPAA
jgi:hypothetical protein